jgi:hypothetical protein
MRSFVEYEVLSAAVERLSGEIAESVFDWESKVVAL